MEAGTLALLIGAPLFLAATSSSSGKKKYTNAEAEKILLNTASEMENRYKIKGLTTFLHAVAYTESRYNPSVSGDSGISIGMFQMQEATAFRPDNELTKIKNKKSKLKNPKLATILAADYVVRNAKRLRSKGYPAQWLAVRRGWANPSLRYDFDEDSERSPKTRARLEKALKALGYPVEFMYREFSVSGYPGIDRVQKDLKVKL